MPPAFLFAGAAACFVARQTLLLLHFVAGWPGCLACWLVCAILSAHRFLCGSGAAVALSYNGPASCFISCAAWSICSFACPAGSEPGVST